MNQLRDKCEDWCGLVMGNYSYYSERFGRLTCAEYDIERKICSICERATIALTLTVVCRNQGESIAIDCSLIFTRYLDSVLFIDSDLQRIFQQHVTSGRFGQFFVERSSYMYQDFDVVSGKASFPDFYFQ